MATSEEIFELGKQALLHLHQKEGSDYKFPPDVIWSSSDAGRKIPAGVKGSLPRKLIGAGYLKATGGVARAQAASRRGSKLPEYTFGPEITGRTPRNPAASQQLSVGTIEDFLAAANAAKLTLDSSMVNRFLASLGTKRFCILTGLAGSGKTKLAEALAMWLSPSPAHFSVVAVGADWTNNEPLLGFADALQPGVYRKPANGVLDLMLRAAADPTQPYFLVLDEMNLSHVERYFADVLAAIESANAPLALHGHPGELAGDGSGSLPVPGRLPLPRNLFFIGTVNVDETTYTFSPKVLDRANVIEFRATRDQLDAFLDEPVRLNLAALQDAQGRGLGAAVGPALVATAKNDHDADALGDDKAAFKAALLDAFDLLANMGAEFGFRSALEMARFAAIHKALGGDDWRWTDALDAQVLQKLLPRLHGSARKLDPVLKALHGFCTTHGLDDSLEKIGRMQKRLDADGFASFAEN